MNQESFRASNKKDYLEVYVYMCVYVYECVFMWEVWVYM